MANENRKRNTGYWVKLRHDRRMAGEGVSCRLLLAGDYERTPNANKYWGEGSYYEKVLIDAVTCASQMITAALSNDGRLHDVIYNMRPEDDRVAWEIKCDNMRLVAGEKAWLERVNEEADGDSRTVVKRIADIAVRESGIVAYLENNS